MQKPKKNYTTVKHLSKNKENLSTILKSSQSIKMWQEFRQMLIIF
jgi:hypothetical protein